MSKYYTPEIEEFHIGFEYEWLDENETWNKTIPTEITIKGFKEQIYGLRVKCLDKEDIESLGWIFTNEYKGLNCFQYQKDKFILLHGASKNRNSLTITVDREGTKFYGNIKNKNELQKLIKQLGI